MLSTAGDGSSDMNAMLHVNEGDGLTIAVSESRCVTQIAKRTVLSDNALSVLVPILEEVAHWTQPQIRRFFESQGFLVQEWARMRTDVLTLRSTSAATPARGARRHSDAELDWLGRNGLLRPLLFLQETRDASPDSGRRRDSMDQLRIADPCHAGGCGQCDRRARGVVFHLCRQLAENGEHLPELHSLCNEARLRQACCRTSAACQSPIQRWESPTSISDVGSHDARRVPFFVP